MHHGRRHSTRSLVRTYARAAAPVGVTTLDAAIPQSTGPTTLEAMASALSSRPRPRLEFQHRSPTFRGLGFQVNPCPKGKHLVLRTRGARAGKPVCRDNKKYTTTKKKKKSTTKTTTKRRRSSKSKK